MMGKNGIAVSFRVERPTGKTQRRRWKRQTEMSETEKEWIGTMTEKRKKNE